MANKETKLHALSLSVEVARDYALSKAHDFGPIEEVLERVYKKLVAIADQIADESKKDKRKTAAS